MTPPGRLVACLGLLLASVGCERQSTAVNTSRPRKPEIGEAQIRAIADYNDCLERLNSTVDLPIVNEITAELAKNLQSDYPARRWNIGKPYVAGEINFLLPKPGTRLPRSCGTDPGYATCWSQPKYGILICSPEMGRHFSRPDFDPPFNDDTQLAAWYYAAAVLGHELGHLLYEGGSERVSHLLSPAEQQGSLACGPPAGLRDSLEQRCDEEGIRLACAAIQSRRDTLPTPNSASGQLARLSALERLFDASWVGDRLCLSSYAYDSTSSRVQHFASAYLSCVVRSADAPIHLLADEISGRLKDVEQQLRTRQQDGWRGTSLYGSQPILFEQAHLVGNWIVYFASSGSRAAISASRTTTNGPQILPTVATWVHAARLISSQVLSASSERWWVREESDPLELHRLLVTCDDTSCAADIEKSVHPPPGRLHRSESGRWLATSGTSIGLFDDEAQLASGTPRVRRRALFSTEDIGLAAMNDKVGVALSFRRNGLFVSEVIDLSGGQHVAAIPFPRDAETEISALKLIGDRAIFLLESTPLSSDNVSLWDCPLSVFAEISVGDCIVDAAPSELRNPLALVTRDLSATDAPTIEPAPTSCGDALVVVTRGWAWLIDRESGRQWTAPANGVAGCFAKDGVTFRAGRVDVLTSAWHEPHRATKRLQ